MTSKTSIEEIQLVGVSILTTISRNSCSTLQFSSSSERSDCFLVNLLFTLSAPIICRSSYFTTNRGPLSNSFNRRLPAIDHIHLSQNTRSSDAKEATTAAAQSLSTQVLSIPLHTIAGHRDAPVRFSDARLIYSIQYKTPNQDLADGY